jgi:hypothetical protein
MVGTANHWPRTQPGAISGADGQIEQTELMITLPAAAILNTVS